MKKMSNPPPPGLIGPSWGRGFDSLQFTFATACPSTSGGEPVGSAHGGGLAGTSSANQLPAFRWSGSGKLRRRRHLSWLLHQRCCLGWTRRADATSGVSPMFPDGVDAAALALHLRGRRRFPLSDGVSSARVAAS